MFRTQLNSKIGNLLAYLATNVDGLSMTKALKLLYIIDETSVKETGVPVTWLDYKVWENGPVAEDIYDEIKSDIKHIVKDKVVSLDNFININRSIAKDGMEVIYLYPKAQADLKEFSRTEIQLIKDIINKYGRYSAGQLIDLLHEEDTLWHKMVQENDLHTSFEIFGKKSNVTIPLFELIKQDEELKLASHAAYESLSFNEKLLVIED